MQRLAPQSHPMYNWSDPKRIGPGAWYMFMITAIHAKTRSERATVCNSIRLFCDFFGCKECSGHCKEYIEENPPEVAISSQRSLFDWIVTFMNSVNHRNKKPAYDKEYLYNLLTDSSIPVCGTNCGGEVKQQSFPKHIPPQNKYVARNVSQNKGSFALMRTGKL